MENLLYNKNHYKFIKSNIKNIQDDADDKILHRLEPTYKERIDISKFVRNYIKKKKFIIYGGTCQNDLIKSKDPEDCFYRPGSINDIEFYSPNPIEDIVEMVNTLFESGYREVNASEAMHYETLHYL